MNHAIYLGGTALLRWGRSGVNLTGWGFWEIWLTAICAGSFVTKLVRR